MSLTTFSIIFSIAGGLISGLIVMAGFLITVGRKYQRLDTVEMDVKEIRKDLRDVRERFTGVEDKVDVLWKDRFAPSSSPRQLNERGETMLTESGIKEIIDNKKDVLLAAVKARESKNPYDAEQAILEVITSIPEICPDVIEKLKTGAFNTGSDIPSILFVGGIYFRNIVFPELGFTIDDIDKHAEK